jgi:CDP-diacylglycerol--serine O-phosphatidyltransferase
MKQIPNLFTLLNLVFGCLAIVFILQTNETIAPLDASGVPQNMFLPESIWWGSLCIFAAAVIDFLDGFVARAMRSTSLLGGQLDSLSDMVSFGVAPAMILYQLLRMGFAQQENGLDISFIYLLPAFIYPCAVAWRLATFNLSTDQGYGFKGLPSPSAGLLIASFPLIKYYEYFQLQGIVTNTWFLYLVIALLCYLMVSRLPLMAMKFKDFSVKSNGRIYLLLILSLLAIIFLRWLAVPVIFIVYLVLSLTAPKTVVRPG